MRRQIVAVAAVLLASVSNVRAITYRLVDYPGSQVDSGGVDHLSGTITTDGVIGTIGSEDMVASFLITTAGGGTYSISSAGFLGDLVATSASLSVLEANDVYMIGPDSVGDTMEVAWLLGDASPGVAGIYTGGGLLSSTGSFEGWVTYVPLGTGIDSHHPWIIATAVPEPGMLTLLVSALLGLAGAAYYLRRRRARAPEATS